VLEFGRLTEIFTSRDIVRAHHLPVTEDERPVGVVGLRSVISALRRGFPGW
jgi:CBS domain-containing protein